MDPFASPHNLDKQLHSLLVEASSNLCDWLAESGTQGPMPDSFDLPEIPPQREGVSNKDLLKELQLLMDGAYRPSHPGALAHLDPPPLSASIVGELICATLNNNLLAEELSPSLSSLERNLCKWFCEKLGLGKSAGGVAASGGSLSNLMALVMARNIAGLESDSGAVFLASEDCHVSLLKAVRIMGLQKEALIKVPTDEKGKLNISCLSSILKKIKSNGKNCFALVATAGTTVRGAIDPLSEIAQFCQKNNIWLHVDGAIGAIYGLSSITSELLQGISFADSVTVNPQKLLGIAKTSSLLLVANKNHLSSSFSTGLPYVEPLIGNDFHGGELGIQGTRSAEALKLWIGLRQLGEEGIEQILLDSIKRRNFLESIIDSKKFQIISGPLHLLALSPINYNSYQASDWSIKTRKYLLSKKFMLSRPYYGDRHYLKAVMGNPNTKFNDLKLLAELINHSII
ncbi:pyridoxal phosphate-dependent decarboxylase family protein [Prochlorococcus marinus]|uniref:Aspartate aminotransferase family protein n=1 Tax=Prochlorococcus marinus XMU1408 TaxID=2213228 RepID=A0A318R0R6_PROMR|nr:aminotransferase class V-fold PLP-dependent enzyme [Prochlorococcus marinus]MBW3041741.1 aspartate aminotransferase family protein [Prochlorococcus marinus str. XMU1408]PYE02886.1 aspartate aminotransferase family protein [Prochlorococcus marinus XMU1408]